MSECTMSYPEHITATLATLRDYIRWGASRFNQAGLFFGHGTANAIDEAASLALFALHLPHNLPGGYFNCVLTPAERLEVLGLLERRIAERKPAAYLTHEAWFCGMPFYVDGRVLVPRSPIAELIEKRFSPWVGEPDEVSDILDLCTGSGCIAVACAVAFPDAYVDAADISPEALDVALTNIATHDVGDQVSAVCSDLFDGLAGKRYDLIVSNPPYVASEEWRNLPSEYHAEPRLGLESGETGLDCVRRILNQAEAHLKPEGLLIVEVGSSAEALEDAYPDVPFCWLEFDRGGDGVFLLTAGQLTECRPELG
jgi:ribosomal protein L3 glutamine methyltransferase